MDPLLGLMLLIAGAMGVGVGVLISLRVLKPSQRPHRQKGEPQDDDPYIQRFSRIEKDIKELRAHLKTLDTLTERHTEEIHNHRDSAAKKIGTLHQEIDALDNKIRTFIAAAQKQQESRPALKEKPAPVPAPKPEPRQAQPKPQPPPPPEPEPMPKIGPRLTDPEIIVRNFDDIDARSMRRIDDMKREYSRHLGKALANLTEMNGAYVFEMADSTAFVHPKPNSPLPRHWERAFPGAESYSRPLKRVEALARIKLSVDGDYEVLEKGSFLVN